MLNNTLDNNFSINQNSGDNNDGKKRKLQIAFDDELINQHVSEQMSKKRIQNDEFDSELIPFYLQDVFLENVFPFMNGRDLNRIRLVCNSWFNFQKGDYFVSNHVARLKLEHDVLNISKKKTQLSIVRMHLGYKQGKMLIIHIEKNDSLSEDLIDEHVLNPACTKQIDDTIISKFDFTKIKSIVGWKDGKKHGEVIDYFKTGEIMQIGHFENGKKHGDFIKYFNSPHVVERTCSYKNDKLCGKLDEYKIVRGLQNQKLVLKDVECSYENGKYHGEKIVYDKDGKITEITNHKNGKLHGVSKYFEVGRGYLKLEVNYQDGKLHGTHKSFFANGTPFETKEYENGKLISQTIGSTGRRSSQGLESSDEDQDEEIINSDNDNEEDIE